MTVLTRRNVSTAPANSLQPSDHLSPVQSAYGLRFRGLPDVPELVSVDGHVPDSELSIRVSSSWSAPPEARTADAVRWVQRFRDGRILAVHRSPPTAIFHGPRLDPGMIAHPYLAPVASAFNRWLGRETLHAGAFIWGERAWVVLGDQTAGKSTLLAALACRGLGVLSDDLVVSDGTSVFEGPRCLDLRDPGPNPDPDLRRARQDTRWRLRLPIGAPSVRLGGFLFLHWGSELAVEPLAGAELIKRLAGCRLGREQQSDPMVLLSMAARPSWNVTRPQRWEMLDPTLDLIQARVSEEPAGHGRHRAAAISRAV